MNTKMENGYTYLAIRVTQSFKTLNRRKTNLKNTYLISSSFMQKK